jgi:hypothetical protein
MPGFTGVGAGKWTIPAPVTPPPSGASRLYAFSGDGSVLASYDGTSWTTLTPPETPVRDVFCAPDDADKLWVTAGTDRHLHYSPDGGATWTARTWPAPGGIDPVDFAILTECILPWGGETIFLSVTNLDTSFDDGVGGLWVSEDAGATFDRMALNLPSYGAPGSSYGLSADHIEKLGADKIIFGHQTSVGGFDHDFLWGTYTPGVLFLTDRVDCTVPGGDDSGLYAFGSPSGSTLYVSDTGPGWGMYRLDAASGGPATGPYFEYPALVQRAIVLSDNVAIAMVRNLTTPETGGLSRTINGGSGWANVTTMDTGHVVSGYPSNSDWIVPWIQSVIAIRGPYGSNSLIQSYDAGATWMALDGAPANVAGIASGGDRRSYQPGTLPGGGG